MRISCLFLLLPGAVLACTSSMDCSLNGECVSGVCKCDRPWNGSTCGELDVDPTPVISYGHGTGNVSSWGGGPPVRWTDGAYHLLVTEIAGGCGMCTWSRMSQIAHAVSPNPQGPFKRVGTAVPTQSHNAYYAFSASDNTHLLYHIFGGNNPESCNPYFTPCSGGITQNCSGLRPPSPWPAPTCPPQGGAHIHFASSPLGPWTSAGSINVSAPGIPPDVSGTSNPAPYIFPNGTVLLIGRGKDASKGHINHNIFLYRASAWNETYHWVPSDGVAGALNIGNGKVPTEDPTIWKGPRGFHMLLHSHPKLTHAWSEDGLTWKWSPQLIGPPDASEGDNERPRVHLSPSGVVQWVFVSQEAGPGDASRTVAFRARV